MAMYTVSVPAKYAGTNYYTVEAKSEDEAVQLVAKGEWLTQDFSELDYTDFEEDFTSVEVEEV